MKFSQRIGVVPVDSVIQTDGMSDALRASLWNVLDIVFWSRIGFQFNSVGGIGELYIFSRNLWMNYYKEPVNSIPSYPTDIMRLIYQRFFSCEWSRVYDFVEFVFQSYPGREFSNTINDILERELAGFRLIDGFFVPITDVVEKEAIEKALESGPYNGAQTHLRQALQNLANREKPDYRNSIKESISAVESLARELSGNPKATLGDALEVLEREGYIHVALKRGFSAIYGYTSDADGIRHAMLEASEVDVTDAIYFLVSCAAFINYLKAKHSKASA